MKTPGFQITLGICLLGVASFAIPARAQTTYNFTSSGSNTGGVYDWSDPANWSPSAVPNLNSNTNVAIIGDGNNVGYYAGTAGDLTISGGAYLYLTSGTLAYTSGGNYFNLGRGATTPGYGNFVINGGVFNETSYEASNPFNAEGTNDTFLISSGTMNLNPTVTFTLNQTNLTWTQSGGVVNGPGATAEFDVANGAQMIMTGGTFDFNKLMNLNGVTNAISFSGGVFADGATGSQGWYGPSVDSFNFTTASTGTMEFDTGGVSLSTVQGWVTAGDISYNDTTASSPFVSGTNGTFTVAQVGSNIDVSLTSVPEPSSYALIGFGGLGMWFFVRRKKTRILP